MNSVPESEAQTFAERITKSNYQARDPLLMRKITITALKALNMGLISLEQMASFHILDAAIRDLSTHATSFFHYKFIDSKGEKQMIQNCLKMESSWTPKEFIKIYYTNSDLCPKTEDTPDEKKEQILRDFFALSEKEWARFSEIMETETFASEIEFFLIPAPQFGCWSAIVAKIQRVTNLCHHTYVDMPSNKGFDLRKLPKLTNLTVKKKGPTK